jgi:hypothetical protein
LNKITEEINKSLKKFLEMFGPKKPKTVASSNQSGFSFTGGDVAMSGYYY